MKSKQKILLGMLVLPLIGCSFNFKVSSEGKSEETLIQSPSVASPVILSLKSSSDSKITKTVDDIKIAFIPEIETMYITNDSSCLTGGVWESVLPEKSKWSFSITEDSGIVSVYGKFRKSNGEETGCLKFDFVFENDSSVAMTMPALNANVQGYHVFHGTCTPGSRVSVESTSIASLPTAVSCGDGQFHIGISFQGSTQGLVNFKIVNTTANGFRKSSPFSVNYQNNGFNSGAGFDGTTADIKIDAGYGKMYVLGDFSSYNGAPAAQLVRLNMDGSRDNTFTSLGFGAYGWLYEMAIDPATHKIYVVGNFPSYSGSGAKIVRINPDGSRDASFNPVVPNNDILAVAFDTSTSKIYIGGYFTNYNATGRNRIARLNNDGTHDTTFVVGSGFSSDVNRIQLDPLSTKIYVSGAFSTYNTSTAVSGLVRLNSDGSLDSSFKAGAYGTVNGVLSVPSTNAVWGALSWGQSTAGNSMNIGSFKYDNGAYDYPWTSYMTLDGEVVDLLQDAATSYIYGIGSFGGSGPLGKALTYVSANIIKIDANGNYAKEFQPGNGTNYSMSWRGRMVADTTQGILYIAGDIANYNGTIRNNLFAISLYDGSLK